MWLHTSIISRSETPWIKGLADIGCHHQSTTLHPVRNYWQRSLQDGAVQIIVPGMHRHYKELWRNSMSFQLSTSRNHLLRYPCRGPSPIVPMTEPNQPRRNASSEPVRRGAPLASESSNPSGATAKTEPTKSTAGLIGHHRRPKPQPRVSTVVSCK